MANNASEQYLNQQIMTASPAQLVFMLYDKAINCLKEAIRAIEAGEIESRWKANNRAIEIVSHLWSTLDMERGGDISKNLGELFPYMITRLAEVDVNNDPAPAREVIGLLEPLRDSWRDLARSNQTGETKSAAAAKNPSAATPNAEPAPMRTSISA